MAYEGLRWGGHVQKTKNRDSFYPPLIDEHTHTHNLNHINYYDFVLNIFLFFNYFTILCRFLTHSFLLQHVNLHHIKYMTVFVK